jgi:hypothetical protein
VTHATGGGGGSRGASTALATGANLRRDLHEQPLSEELDAYTVGGGRMILPPQSRPARIFVLIFMCSSSLNDWVDTIHERLRSAQSLVTAADVDLLHVDDFGRQAGATGADLRLDLHVELLSE